MKPDAPPLRILAPTRYPWRFNGPAHSRHHVENRDFAPLNRLSPKIEGVTAFNPWPPRRFDLVHAFNRIPLGRTPFVIGFESHLPRAFGLEGGRWERWLTARIEDERCRAVIAISEFARRLFMTGLARRPPAQAARLEAKLHVRLPNLAIPPAAPREPDAGGIRLVFVGNHFARKGGCVAVLMAELARARGLPLVVDVVSKLEMGGAIWTDPADADVFRPYLALLDQPNVRLHRGLPNAEVLALLRRADFSLLATFGDTFGYSALESMAVGTPVVATRQGALPEVVDHMRDGVLLDLPTTPDGEWVHLASRERGSPGFARMWADEVRRLAEEALAAVAEVAGDPARMAAMRDAARASAERFSAEDASPWWDAMYDRAARGVVAAPAHPASAT